MGDEYRISFPSTKASEFQEIMRRLGGQASSTDPNRFEFGMEGPWPYATVLLDAEGIYFCDNCVQRDQASQLFRKIIDGALSQSPDIGRVTVSDL